MMKSEESKYRERLRTEIERFSTIENVHDLPPIFWVWARKFVLPKISEVCARPISVMDEFYATYISRYADENPLEEISIVSIGAGNGDLEARVAASLRASGIDRFRFQCLDINPVMLTRGREAVWKEHLNEHFDFLEMDISHWVPTGPVSVVIAHQSLHHIEPLESTFAKIHNAIGRKGYFLVCDTVGRNGHMRWPEALDIIHDIWRTMPDRYKYNHQLQRFEEVYENWDCSTESFEGIRAQDILPLLVELFEFEAFAGFGNIPDIFVDRAFGHNLSPDNAEDLAFIDRIGQLNDHLIGEGKIKPTQIVAVMHTGASKTKPRKYHLQWTPEFCVRSPNQDPVLKVPLGGCGTQRGEARGIWPDGWISSPFGLLIQIDDDTDSLVIEGFLPAESQHQSNICVNINGVDLLNERVEPGLFSLRAYFQIPAGQLIYLRVTSDKSYCPLRSGTGKDERELAMILCRIRLQAVRRLTSAT